ncbi:MAG: Uma2 family endonuclease [Chloroflexi bacterium]|nr:Uma2 family endonuclease [Chloroflexota bacterium]
MAARTLSMTQTHSATEGALSNRVDERRPPPLQNGDQLTRDEFERRYAVMPEIKKAELIEGIVYMASPVHIESHSEPHSNMIGWLVVYQAATPGVRSADNASTQLDPLNEYQPDALLRLLPEAGGRSHVTEDNFLKGPPELVVEIAASSASHDLRTKFRVYERVGVREYIVWQVYEKRIDWWALDEHTEQFVPLAPRESGMLRSQFFPGLWLNVPAMVAGDLAAVLATLQQGIASSEHTAFVDRLRASLDQQRR